MTALAGRPTAVKTAQTVNEQQRAETAETARQKAVRYVWAGLRIALGWTFLWAFIDKVFGLGHGTEAKAAWINGGSPTQGFLKFGAAGPFKGFYNTIAGTPWADWLFMAALAALGVALLLGIGLRVAAVAGGLLFVMMWTAVLPPENNLFMDDHLIDAAVLAGIALTAAGDTAGLGRAWARLPIVQRLPWLK
jgi:thiosulfate dehydrogenase [quinone] large subunit